MPEPVESTLKAEDGCELFVRDWPCAAPQAAGSVLVMHGLGEHCGRYAHVARFFNERGWAVRTYDHRGHGRSDGPRGDVPDGGALLRDAAVVARDMASKPGWAQPPLLFGHSMGGLVAAHFATHIATDPAAAGGISLRALALSSPALALPLSAIQKGLLRTLGAVSPGLGVDNGLKPCFLSHDPAVVAAYENDPFVHSKISARLLRSMLEAIDFAHTHAPKLALPTLLLAAGDDRLVDARGSEAFFARLAPGIGTLRRYDGLYHEIFNEVQAPRVFADLGAWLETLH